MDPDPLNLQNLGYGQGRVLVIAITLFGENPLSPAGETLLAISLKNTSGGGSHAQVFKFDFEDMPPCLILQRKKSK